jgi:hypothetical protein
LNGLRANESWANIKRCAMPPGQLIDSLADGVTEVHTFQQAAGGGPPLAAVCIPKHRP